MTTQSLSTPSLILLLSALSAVTGLADQTKADNISTLDLGASWGGTAPINTDLANWSGLYNTANSLSAGFAASANLSWLGVKIGNITGSAAGLVSIGGTGAAATGSKLTLGTGGIDMAAANQNVVINVATLAVSGAAQTWNVATGRNVRLGITGTGAANANFDGADGTVITVTGGGVVDANQGGTAGGFADAAGFGDFNGKWVVDANTTLRGLRHGATAWGSNTAADAITLKGGTLATGGITGAVGNWSWTSPITLFAGTNSIIDNQNIAGTNRWLKLAGALSGTGNLTFASTGIGTMSVDNGFILASSNSLSGTVTINSGVFVRLGGLVGTDITTAVGAAGDLGTASIVNNGTLTLSHNNTWTFANNVSGSGVLRVGITTGSATHIVTVAGNNSHTGGTILQSAVTLNLGSSTALGTGNLTISGNGIFDNLSSGAIVAAGGLTMSGGSPTFTGSNPLTLNGSVLISTANRTITVNGSTLTLGGNITEDVSPRGLTKAGAGTLVLSGTNAYTGATTVNAGTLSVSGGNALPDGAAVTLANTAGVLLVLNANETIGGLSGGGATGGNVNVGAFSLTINPPVTHSDFSGALQGSGTVIKAGANQLRLLGTSTFSGTHQINAGLTVFNSTGADDGSPNVAINGDTNTGIVIGDVFVGGKMNIGSLSGTGGKVRVDWNTTAGVRTLAVTQAGNTTFAGVMEDAGLRILGLEKNGGGTLTLTGANTATGPTVVNSGTLALSGTGSLSDATDVSLTSSAATFDFSGLTGPVIEKVKSLNALAGSTVATGGNTVEFGDTADMLVAANISGNGGGIKKTGSGTLTFAGNNTYTGTTNLNAGTLLLGSGTSLPDSAELRLSTGTTLSTGGFSDTTGKLTVAGNSTINLAGGSNNSTLNFGDASGWTGILQIWNWNGPGAWTAGTAANTRLLFATNSLTAAELANVHFYSDNGITEIGLGGGGFVGKELVPVPEVNAAGAALLLLGMVGTRELRRARK